MARQCLSGFQSSALIAKNRLNNNRLYRLLVEEIGQSDMGKKVDAIKKRDTGQLRAE